MPAHLHQYLQARKHPHEEVRHRQPKGLSPAAVGLLVPIFIVFLFGPLLCILLVRKRRRNRPRPSRRRIDVSAPNITREDARKTLKGYTLVSTIADVKTGDEKRECMGVAEREVVDRDCAICLSTLHAPSPPEPAKISSESSSNITSSRPSSIANLSLAKEIEKEDILRLNVCSHEFHAECLISWFVISKYSCPICRAVYFEKEEEREKQEGGAVGTGEVDGGGRLESQSMEGSDARRHQV